jgi:hypothetical protein
VITTTALASAGLPAIAALLGVGLTLAFNARQERARQRADLNKALWDARANCRVEVYSGRQPSC